MGLFKLLEVGFGYVYKIFNKQSDKGKVDSKQEIDLALLNQSVSLILTNHLPHIQKDLEINTKDHTDIKIMQARLEEKIDILLKR